MTPEGVKLRIREAWDTLRRVPAPSVPGYRSAWPEVIQDYFDAYGAEPAMSRLEPASPRAIDRMHETFGWFKHIVNECQLDTRHKTRAVWLCVGCGMGPRRAGYIMGVSRWTAARWRDDGIQAIVTGLSRSNTCNQLGSNATCEAR